MKNPEDYLTENSRENITTIIRRAQEDAYREGYQAAAQQMFEIAVETTAKVDKLTVEALSH